MREENYELMIGSDEPEDLLHQILEIAKKYIPRSDADLNKIIRDTLRVLTMDLNKTLTDFTEMALEERWQYSHRILKSAIEELGISDKEAVLNESIEVYLTWLGKQKERGL